MHGMVIIDSRQTTVLGWGGLGVKVGTKKRNACLHSNNGGSLGCSLAERSFCLVLPEPIFEGQYAYGLAVFVRKSLRSSCCGVSFLKAKIFPLFQGVFSR